MFGDHADPQVALRGQVDQLTAEFEEVCSRDQIEERVGLVMQQYADARIQTFVPLLVGRGVREWLRARRSTLAGIGEN